jgi:branched-chain amino acid aminotransferase
MDITQVEHIMNSDPAHTRAPHDRNYELGSGFAQGKYSPIMETSVPILDTGFIHADAAYDVVSASKGYIFRLDDHLKRFRESCEKFLLQNPYSDEETAEILINLVKLAGVKDAYIWWCVTRGVMLDVDRRVYDSFDNQFYAFVEPYVWIANDEQRSKGFNLLVSNDFIRIPSKAVDPTAKNFHWMDMKLSIFEAVGKGYEWSVLTDAEGNLTEAPGCNVFFIKDDVLYTPDSGCLEGITRKTVLELAADVGLKTDVTRVSADQLRDADEAFLTSTAGGVMPVSLVDGNALGGRNSPGPMTTQLHNIYWQKRWDGWLGTPVEFETIG